MSRRKHVRQAPAGCGQNAGRGLAALAKEDYQAAIDSVPRLEFDQAGTCKIDNPSKQLLAGLRILAAKPDQKILADTGESHPVWSLVVGDDCVVVVHNRYAARYNDQQEAKRKIQLVGRLNFHGSMADYMPESEEHLEGLRLLVDEQNRLARKYPGRKGMKLRIGDDGRCFIAKVTLEAA